MGEIEIGYTVEKERWLAASENLHEFGQIMADIMLACTAIGYVAEFAVDKCRFIPLPGGGQK